MCSGADPKFSVEGAPTIEGWGGGGMWAPTYNFFKNFRNKLHEIENIWAVTDALMLIPIREQLQTLAGCKPREELDLQLGGL